MCVSFLRSYASDVTSGLSDGYEGLSEKSEKTGARRTAGKLFRRRARSRLRITGVREINEVPSHYSVANEFEHKEIHQTEAKGFNT